MIAVVETDNKWHAETKYFNYYANLVLYCVVLIPFLSFAGIEKIVGETAYSVLQSAAAAILGLMVIFKARKLRRDRFVVLYVILQGLIFTETVIHYGFNMGILVVICVSVFLVLLVQKDAAIILRALTIIATLSLVLNAGYILALGSGDRLQYFIGGKNSFSVFLVPMCFFAMANSLARKGRITRSTVALVIMMGLTILWGRSAAGIVTVGATVILLAVARKNKPVPAIWLIAIAVMHIALVFFLEILSGTSLWRSLMEWLGKDDTLTSRAAIWEKALSIIENNWVFGVGRGTQLLYTSRWGYNVIATEAHNFLLELWLEGGIVGLCVYAVLIWTTVKKMDMDSKLHRLLFVGYMAMMVNGLAEAINNHMVVNLMLALMYACSNMGICEKNYGH